MEQKKKSVLRRNQTLSRFTAHSSRLAQDTWQSLVQARFFLVAASLSYTTILSFIPLLAVSFALFHAFGGTEKLYHTLEPLVLSHLAQGSGEEAIHTLQKLILQARSSVLGIGGLIGLLLTSISMLHSVEKAVNQVWQTPLRRGWFQRLSNYWLLLTLGPLGLSALATAALLLGHGFLRSLSFLGIAILVFFGIYKWVPNTQVKAKFAFTSAVLTAIVWQLARIGFGLYTKNFAAYNRIYGSLGAIPILLLWIDLIWVILLAGSALTAAMQKRSLRMASSHS